MYQSLTLYLSTSHCGSCAPMVMSFLATHLWREPLSGFFSNCSRSKLQALVAKLYKICEGEQYAHHVHIHCVHVYGDYHQHSDSQHSKIGTPYNKLRTLLELPKITLPSVYMYMYTLTCIYKRTTSL